MPTFNGTLKSNEIFAALFNMIISQQVFADNIKGTNARLVDRARVDGTLYGDTKLYYSTDALTSSAWGNDAEALNLLALHRPPAPKCQAIVIDVFRQISLTVDNYLSKRAWGTEGAFSQFNSVMLGWLRETKKIYDSTTYNAYFGTCEGASNKNLLEVPLSDITETGEEKNRLEAETIAQNVADLLIDMTNVSRDYNDYGFIRSYDLSEIKIVWNAKWLNKIKKLDIPTIFNNSGLMDKFDEVLPPIYFGKVNASGASTPSANTNIRALVELEFNTVAQSDPSYDPKKHCFPGELLPNSQAYKANTTYTVDEDIICKVYVELPPYMSAFEVGTSFFNAKSLTENHYLTFGHNTIEYLMNYPMTTVHAD